jgi:nucleoside diphosphate-linked moiety X motif protein 19
MAAVLKHWREAATLILATSSKFTRGAVPQLTKSSANSVTKASSGEDSVDNFDVLVLKRSSKSKFMPNLHVFPGGAAVNNDFSAEWVSVFGKLGTEVQQNLFKKLSTGGLPMFTRQREPRFSTIPAEVAFRICAIRETFEESGILLAIPTEVSKDQVNSILHVKKSSAVVKPSVVFKEDSTILNEWRKRVNEDPDEFLTMCIELDLIPEVWALYDWSNWLTPVSAEENKRRFDTAFFVSCVHYKPEAVQDAAETVSALWSSPSSLLTAYFEQQGGLAAPQVYELCRLLHFKSANKLLEFVSHPNRSTLDRFLPYPVYTKDHYLHVLPGDDLYPKRIDSPVENIFDTYDESLDELSKKHSNHNRLVMLKQQQVFDVQSTIQPHRGHVYPNISALNGIKMRAKL